MIINRVVAIVLLFTLTNLLFINNVIANPPFEPATKLGLYLYRTLTRNWGNHMQLNKDDQFLFMHTHWTKHFVQENFKGCLLRPNQRLDPPEFYQIALYQELAKRITDNEGQFKFSDKVHSNRKIPNKVDVKPEVKIQENFKNFVPGHFYTVKSKVTVPKLMIAFNDDATFDLLSKQTEQPAKNKSFSSWFIPLEQALLFSNVGQYRNSLALLRHWSAYSRLSLGFLPVDSEVYFKIGLVSPQSFPSFKDKSNLQKRALFDLFDQGDIEPLRQSLVNIGSNKDNITSLFEYLDGGATQIFIAYAEPSYLIPLDALYLNGEPYKPRFSRVKKANEDVWPPLLEGEKSHLIDDEINKVEINIPKALKKLGILRKDGMHEEEEDFHNVIKNSKI